MIFAWCIIKFRCTACHRDAAANSVYGTVHDDSNCPPWFHIFSLPFYLAVDIFAYLGMIHIILCILITRMCGLNQTKCVWISNNRTYITLTLLASLFLLPKIFLSRFIYFCSIQPNNAHPKWRFHFKQILFA